MFHHLLYSRFHVFLTVPSHFWHLQCFSPRGWVERGVYPHLTPMTQERDREELQVLQVRDRPMWLVFQQMNHWQRTSTSSTFPTQVGVSSPHQRLSHWQVVRNTVTGWFPWQPSFPVKQPALMKGVSFALVKVCAGKGVGLVSSFLSDSPFLLLTFLSLFQGWCIGTDGSGCSQALENEES